MSQKKHTIIQDGKYELVFFFLSFHFLILGFGFLIPQFLRMIFVVVLMVEWWTGFGKTFRFR